MKMKDAEIGRLVKVTNPQMHNPAGVGIGRILLRSPKYKKVCVDSMEFPAEIGECSGWWRIEDCETVDG